MIIDFQDADIAQVIAAVQLATHQTFVIDPRAHAQVTMHSATLREQFCQAVLNILEKTIW